jgi:hypothetical protein
MDSETKATLKLIEQESMQLELESRGRQLVYLARDYLEDEDLFEVRRLLRLVEASYFTDFMHQHIADDGGYAKAIAHLVEVLGHDFWLFASTAIATA